MGLTTRLTIFTPILLSLAACLGSNEGTGALDDPETRARIAATRNAPVIQGLPGATGVIDDVLAAAAMESAPSAARAGTASYSGALLAANDEISTRGDLALRADFDNGSLTGSVTNITAYDVVHPGEVDIVAGALTVAGTITADGLTASMTGTIYGEEDGPLAVSGQFEGDFRGADAEVVAGVGELDVEGDETMDAVFVANRDE